MKAFVLGRYGKKSALRLTDVPAPRLREITRLVDAGVIRPVIDRLFPFASTNEALAYVEGGRAKGKVVIKVR